MKIQAYLAAQQAVPLQIFLNVTNFLIFRRGESILFASRRDAIRTTSTWQGCFA